MVYCHRAEVREDLGGVEGGELPWRFCSD